MRFSPMMAGLFVTLCGIVALRVWFPAGGPPSPPPVPKLTVLPLAMPEVVRQGTLAPGETLLRLFGRLGLGGQEAYQWTEEARRLLNVHALPVGLVAEARWDTHGVLRSLRLVPDWSMEVVLERTERGLAGRREVRPAERELVVVAGGVEASLMEAVVQAGETERLALALAEVFQWDIDFHREVQRGDRFAVLVERVRAGERTVAYGPVLAASYRSGGRQFTAVRFATGGSVGYYDRQGRPLRRQFLRAPLKLTRVTSQFSPHRRHPVLGRTMPHWGVDYAAPEGTPVMVTADGVVTFVGWKGGGGNTVEVRHGGGYTTGYLHLSRFANGLAVGRRVRQGEVIGYVGATGLATGPHLDYRVLRHGRYIHPQRLGQEPAPPLPEQERPTFAAHASALMALLEVPGKVAPAQVAELVGMGAPWS